jgi:hypothetical protein
VHQQPGCGPLAETGAHHDYNLYRLQFDWTLASSVTAPMASDQGRTAQESAHVGNVHFAVASLSLSSCNQSFSPTRCRISFSQALGSVP